jgi:hypothetical protein
MKILTVQEFIDNAMTSKDIVISVKRDYYDGQGAIPRCECKSPVSDLEYNVKTGSLIWDDDNGSGRFSGLKPTDLMEELDGDNGYYTTCYWKESV